jgi:hypothetical protein
MSQQDIWINLMESANQRLHHLLLILEDMDHRITLLLQLLLKVIWQWSVVQFSHEREFLHFKTVGRAILVDVVVNQA